MKCRDYVANSWHLSIVQALHEGTRSRYSFDLNIQTFRDALTLGRIAVLFDGIDEIADGSKRLEFVRRIEEFAALFPLCSILATARLAGYRSAELDGELFRHYHLSEFSDEQVRHYVDQWFRQMDLYDLRTAFMRESESVKDIRANPLMLSLMCILYRARGAIPRDRRDIYGRCADLLFHRWDPWRHIEQPEEMPKNGDRIIQAIALWFYDHQVTQEGVGERVIIKIISDYLVDAIGIDVGPARRRAEDFLLFCTGRAWLLAFLGRNVRGERLFGFTHRTFFEYFAAEAAARRATGAADLAVEIVKIHDRDPTTVLPELLIQAYDAKSDLGARDVFEGVCLLRESNEDGRQAAKSDSAWNELLLRLMNAASLPRQTRRDGFQNVTRTWLPNAVPNDLDAFVEILNMGADVREQFEDEFLRDASCGHGVQREFLRRWGILTLMGAVDQSRPLWNRIAQDLLHSYSTGTVHLEPVILNWAAERGLGRPEEGQSYQLLAIRGYEDRPVPGAIWWAVERYIMIGTEYMPHHIRLCRALIHDISAGKKIDRHEGFFIAEAIEWRARSAAIQVGLNRDMNFRMIPDEAFHALIAIGLLMCEIGFERRSIGRVIEEMTGIALESLVRIRRDHVAQAGTDLEFEHRTLELIRKYPLWVRQWTLGDLSLVDDR